jgi:DNA-binding ferritin-like protein (Dps family)
MDQELNENYTKETKEFINRSKKLFDRYYDDVKKIEWMSDLTSDELFLNIKMRPKKLKKYFK